MFLFLKINVLYNVMALLNEDMKTNQKQFKTLQYQSAKTGHSKPVYSKSALKLRWRPHKLSGSMEVGVSKKLNTFRCLYSASFSSLR